MFIDSSEKLEQFCSEASVSRVLAVDTEFIREKTYHPQLCLIQLATQERSAAIDPIVLEDLSPLVPLFENHDITKVFHASAQDLEVIYAALGCELKPVFDTQLAAAFLGMRQQSSYASVVEQFEGVHLEKAESLTDWSKRPLSASQLEYAEDDVVYLPRIYEKMIARLSQEGRLSWVFPEMEKISDKKLYVRSPEEAYLHLKRVTTLTRKQLALAKELCAWRERAAAKRDIPRKRVVTDEIIVELCKKMPTSEQALRSIRGTDHLSRRDADHLLHAISRGMAVPASQYPKIERKQRLSPEHEGIVDLMYALARLVGEREAVAPQLLATRDDLADFMLNPKNSRLSSGWRYELLGTQLEALLSGNLGLTVKGGKIELL